MILMQQKRSSFFLRNRGKILLFSLTFHSLEKFMLRGHLFIFDPWVDLVSLYRFMLLLFFFEGDCCGEGIGRPLKILLTGRFIKGNLLSYNFILSLYQNLSCLLKVFLVCYIVVFVVDLSHRFDKRKIQLHRHEFVVLQELV